MNGVSTVFVERCHSALCTRRATISIKKVAAVTGAKAIDESDIILTAGFK
jgi:hypothetical protein